MTPTLIVKAVGIGAGITLAAVGAFKAGRAAASEPAAQIAQSTISAPAATTVDIAALREHFDRRFDDVNLRQDGFNGRLSTIEGYMKAQQQAALEKAVAGKGTR